MTNLTPRTAFGQTIRIDQQDYTFVSHTTALKMAYAQTGGKGTVYQLKGSDGQHWALKVFHPQYRHPRITTINGALKENYESIPSVTIWRRLTIRHPKHNALLEEYPDLEYAVLMPWVEGDNWENYWSDEDQDKPLDAAKSLRLAVELGKTLSQMEQTAIAHCDLAGSNIMVDPSRARVELIDIEDSFIHGIQPPSAGSIPLGTSGYQHTASRGLDYGLWCAEGDRFAGAVLLAELLTWHVPEIRAASDGAKHYFQDSDLKEPKRANERFKLMVDVLKTGSTEVADLFARAWGAPTLVECPQLTYWYEALKKAQPTDASIFNILEAPVLNVAEYASEDEKDGPLFSWSEVKGAKDYLLEFSLKPDFQKSEPKICSDYRYRSKENDKENRIFYARVKARSGKRESAWSKSIVFGRLPATKLSKDGAANEIRLRWTNVPKASYYVASIVGNGVPQEDRECQVTECKLDFTAYAPGTYTVFVRAFGSITGFQGRLVGYASNAIKISVPARRPEGLAVSKTGFAAKVTWQPVEYAAYYRIMCQPLGESGFDPITQEVRSPFANFKLPPGAYEFRVVALTDDEIASEAATRRETIGGLKTPQPQLTMPDKGKKPTIRWDRIDFADKYRLEFERNGKLLDTVETSHLNYSLNSDWEPGIYQTRVRALAKLDGFPEMVSSEPSNPVIVPIQPPRPTWERSKVRVDENTVTLDWNKLLRVTHYRVYYRDTVSNQVEWTEVNETKIRLTLPPATYDFWLVAYYGDIASEESRIQPFVLEKPIPVPTWVRASSEQDTIYLQWTPVEEATGYKVEIQGAIPTNVVDWDDTYLEVCNPPGVYTIRVAARIGELQSQWSEEVIVKTELATPRILGPDQIEPGQDFTVEWTEVPFADSYKIYDYGYIHPQNQKVRDKPINEWGSSTTSRRLMPQSHHGQMAFRVVAFRRDASGEEYTSESELHIVRVATVEPPPLIQLEKVQSFAVRISGQGSHIQWDAVSSANLYRIEWAVEQSFVSQNDRASETSDTFTIIPFPGLYARIKALNTVAGVEGEWSYTLVLPSYENGRIETEFISDGYQCFLGERAIINWRLADETSDIHEPRFELQIASAEDFANSESYEIFGFSTTLSFKDAGTRFARVRFTRDSYRYAWSSIALVLVQTAETESGQSHPTTPIPADAQPPMPKPRLGGFLKNLLNRPKELQRPMLKVDTLAELILLHWSAISSATHYEIQVTAPNGKKSTSKPRSADKGTELRVPKEKLTEGVYSCQVVAINQELHLKSEISNIVTFQR